MLTTSNRIAVNCQFVELLPGLDVGAIELSGLHSVFDGLSVGD